MIYMNLLTRHGKRLQLAKFLLCTAESRQTYTEIK